MHFSGTFKTHTMKIDLLTARSNLIFSASIAFDILNQKVPPNITLNLYYFLTDSHQIYYDPGTQKFILLVISSATSQSYSFTIKETPYWYGWNQFMFVSQPTTDGTGMNYYVSWKNNWQDTTQTFVGTVPEIITMRYICFCNTDTGVNCCGMSNGITWSDVWLRDLSVWDGGLASVWTVMSSSNMYLYF
jgi:hypothetical protein